MTRLATRLPRTKPRLKKLHDQVIVITGATSGIGLATARMAAERGARLVLVARNQQALQKLAEELGRHGTTVVSLAVDVANPDDVRRVENAALEQFGGFDTWINNAAVTMYGRLLEVPLEDERQLFETNYWGMVHGSRIAAEHLARRGGALINVASTNSDYAAPLQGTYSASEHAIKGYTDALRMELETENAPVSVTLVKPGPVDTPFTRHARNYLDTQPKLTPPVYAPEVAAEAILFCAEHPRRDIIVGGGGKLFALAGRISPRLADRLVGRFARRMQKSGRAPEPGARDALYQPAEDLEARGDYPGRVMKSSLYTKAALRPKRTGALILASGIVAGLLWRAHRNNGKTQARTVTRKSEKAVGRLLSAGRSLEHAVEKRGRKAARQVPKLARRMQHGIERTLPRH